MRTLACLGFVSVVTSANAQTTTTTVHHKTHTARTSPEHPASEKIRAVHFTARATAATHPGGDDQPMGDRGKQQMDADSNKPVSR